MCVGGGGDVRPDSIIGPDAFFSIRFQDKAWRERGKDKTHKFPLEVSAADTIKYGYKQESTRGARFVDPSEPLIQEPAYTQGPKSRSLTQSIAINGSGN